MDFFEAVNSRRSVRRYLDEAVALDVLEQIVAAGVEAPSGCNVQGKQYVIVDDPELMEKIRPISPAFNGAPAVIALLMDPIGTKYGEFWIQDAAAAMENMLLAATALGYASCWVEGQVRPHEAELHDLLGVPENLHVWSMMPVGKSAVDAKRPPKPTAANVTHYNRFGEKKA